MQERIYRRWEKADTAQIPPGIHKHPLNDLSDRKASISRFPIPAVCVIISLHPLPGKVVSSMLKKEKEVMKPLEEDELDAVVGGITSKQVTKRSKRKVEGRRFDMEKHNDTLILPTEEKL